MIILSTFTTDKKFAEIENFAECEGIDSNTCVFFRVQDENLESYFRLARELSENEIEYGVLLDFKLPFLKTALLGATLSKTISLKTTLLMFSSFNAKYFILDSVGFKDSADSLVMLQNIANYYLLDIKILVVVESYKEIERLCFLEGKDSVIGVDGVIEKSVLQP